MTKTITQKLTDELNIHKPLRTYFDRGSHQFNQTNIDEKIQTLAKIIFNGYDLNEVVKQYKQNYSSDNYIHVYKNAIPTLQGFISYLHNGNSFDLTTYRALENASGKDVIKLLTETIKEKVLKNQTIENLILSYVDYKFNNKPEEYKKLSVFFNIDFEKDNDKELYERSKKENIETIQWNYVPLNHYLKRILFANIIDNRISDLDPRFEMPMTKSQIHFINKHYPKSIHEKLKNNSEFRKSKILGFAKDLVEVLYLNKPMFDFNIFYIRNNFKVEEFREEILKKNQAAILVDQDFEKEDWNLILQGKKRKNKKTEFIGRWLNLDKSLIEKDALLVSTYLGNSTIKIGLLPKGSTYFSHPKNSDFKVFQLENVKEIDRNENQIFSSLIPSQTTLSPIYQRSSFIISKYIGEKLPTIIENLSPNSIELMCMEWLRSDFAPKELQLKYQLLKIGGNFQNIDIYGISKSNQEIAAQVTMSNNIKTITNKIKKLKETNIAIQVMFCATENEHEFEIPTFSIQNVFDDLYESDYKMFLDKLIGQ
ncbi:MAG TPA: hypothetical protein VKY41_11165 [Xanthomarina sp.]|nr:hypothetical protein [Xanthomarina sp.]